MASAALLFSFSAILFLFVLLQAPAPAPGLASLLASAVDRFLGGRGLLEVVATRRNMILLCHAILVLVLRDAGVLGARASRRSRGGCPSGEATAAGVVEIITCSAAPARPHATRSAVVWRRRPRNRAAAPMHDGAAAAACRLVECRPAAEAVATWAAPPRRTTGPPEQAAEEAAAVATKQIVLVESPRNDEDLLDRHDRTATVEHPTATAVDGDDDRRAVAVANGEKLVCTARERRTAGMEMELADDRTFEEFIRSQRRKMRQESLRYQATAACY